MCTGRNTQRQRHGRPRSVGNQRRTHLEDGDHDLCLVFAEGHKPKPLLEQPTQPRVQLGAGERGNRCLCSCLGGGVAILVRWRAFPG